MGLKDWAAYQIWDTGNQHLITAVVLRQMLEMHLLLLSWIHNTPSLSVTPSLPFPSPSSLSLSLLPRLMAVEDELRGGPVIEPKTRIFADQVCETASSLVESVRWPVLSSLLSPSIPLFFPPATVIISSAVCMWSPLIVLPCPRPVPVSLGLTAILSNIPGSFEGHRVLLFAFLSSSCMEMSDSSWVCGHISVCDDVSVEHVGVKTP